MNICMIFVVTQATNINRGPSCNRTIAQAALSCSINSDITMDSGGITGYPHQYGPGWQYSPQTSAWSQVVTQTKDICMAFGDNLCQGYHHVSQLLKDQEYPCEPLASTHLGQLTTDTNHRGLSRSHPEKRTVLHCGQLLLRARTIYDWAAW